MTTTNPYIHTYYVNLRNGADIRREKQPLASGDKNADVFLVHLQDGGKVVSLDGAAVTGKVIRADGQTVPLAGSVADGAAKITLDENCYAVPGEIKLTVTVSAGDVVQSVLIVTMDVQTSETSIVVDNGVIGTLSELLAEIENMRAATQEATDATAAANAAIDAANTALDETAADAQAAIAQAIRDTDAAVTEIRAVATQSAPPIVAEADGALVTIGDGAARPVVQLVSSMAAVQSGSGEPSPENVRAITGWDSATVHRTGENLVSLTDYTTTNGHAATVITADVIDVVTPSAYDYGRIPMSIKGGVTYTLVIDWEVYGRDEAATDETRASYRLNEIDITQLSVAVVTNRTQRIVQVYRPEADADTFLQWNPNYGSAVPAASRSRVMLLVGEYTADTAPAFVPGKCTALTAALPETVYGGHLDWVSGLLTVTHGLITLDGTEAWGGGDGSPYYLIQGIPRAGISAVPPVCSHYLGADVYHTSQEGVQATPTKIWLRDKRFVADAAGLQAWIAAQAAAGTPVQIVYQLAEPYTIQLDPQALDMLKGNNAVWSDCGDTAVSYVVDTKTYVDAHAVGSSGGSVASVNGKTGAVVLNAADVGAMPADAQIVDADAREQIAELSEEIAELKDANTITKTGTVIEMECPANAQIEVSGDVAETVRLFHGGINLLPAPSEDKTVNGCTFTANADGTVNISGTPTAVAYYYIADRTNPLYLPAGQYALIPYGFPDVSSQIVLYLESVNGSNDFYKTITVNSGINNFTLDASRNFLVHCTVRKTYTGEERNLGIMLIRTEGAISEKPDYVRANIDIEEVTLPAVLSAHTGINTVYVDSGAELTAKVTVSKTDNAFDFAEYTLPVLYLNGDISLMDKDNAVDLIYVYGNLSGTASVKWQGSSSLNYPKKNYTVKFDNAFVAVEGWGEQKKYCMKANFIDFSHCRNVCGAKLWGQIVANRATANVALSACPNYGAVDGFPICIVINGEYMGVYTFNIPKDGWMANMGSGTNEAILCADLNSEADAFKAEAVVGGNYSDFELEYTTDEENTAWIQTSLNTLINACIASDGTDLDTTIATMLDWESAIDYYIFCALTNNYDGIVKNYLLFTYDGTKWLFSAYDLDSTFGGFANGSQWWNAKDGMTLTHLKGRHRVFELIYNHKKEALKARYAELRGSVLSEDNVQYVVRNFATDIPRVMLDEDNRKWPTIPGTNVSNVQQILDWYRLRVARIDAEVEAL